MKRTLNLAREALNDLTTDELATIQAGIPTFEGPVCYVVNPTELRCLRTIVGSECNTLVV